MPDRQLSLAIGKEGQNARLAAKLTGWRIDIKSETEAATEGLSEIKRQQLQMMKARSLEDKAAAAPGDDLLSRAEWLLREKDKTAVTLEQAAAMLAEVEATDIPPKSRCQEAPAETVVATEVTAPAPEVPEVEAEVALAPVVTEPEVADDEKLEATVPAFTEMDFGEAEFEEVETEEGEGASKTGKSKKTAKKRELVFDEQLGQVVSRRKRKPGRSGWLDDIEG